MVIYHSIRKLAGFGCIKRSVPALPFQWAAWVDRSIINVAYLNDFTFFLKMKGLAMKSTASCYLALREYIETLPVIDCHDHTLAMGPKPTDPVKAVIDWYMRSDLISASSDREVEIIFNEKLPLEERWPVLERAWRRSKHTGYAQVVRRALRAFYQEPDLTLEGLRRIAEKMIDFSDEANFTAALDKAHIVARLADNWPDLKGFIAGKVKMPPRSRLMIPLPGFHNLYNANQVQGIAGIIDQHVTSLDEYVAACREIFTRLKAAGAVGFKDQSAYERTLAYGMPTRQEAEEAFNWLMADPRRSLSYPDGARPLSDYLFHHFMRMARPGPAGSAPYRAYGRHPQ